jgi:creatinine amidohydrolase
MSKTNGLLETMTISGVEKFRPEVVVIPLGSTEPHGPHLPYGTDTLIVDGVTAEAVRIANESGARVLRLPPLPIGNNVNFKGFPFACRISVETLTAVIMDLVSFVHEEGVRKIVLVNGHGGNDSTIKACQRRIYDRFQQDLFVCSCSTWQFSVETYKTLFTDGSPHAGDYETSMVQHFAPHLVVTSALAPAEMHRATIPELRQDVHWVKAWHHHMPSSCGGRPDQASAEKGKTFAADCTAKLGAFLVNLSREPWHPRFPFPAE